MPKILKNLTDVDQSAYQPDGTRVIVPAFAEVQLDDTTADLFLRQRPGIVVEHQPVKLPSIRGDELVWMANASGSPSIPKTVAIQLYDRELKAYVKSEIPMRTAKPLQYEGVYEMGQVRVGDNELGQVWESRGTVPIKIPPYTRVPVSQTIADWIERDCSMRMPESRHHVVKCRAPVAYEPNNSWDYLDMHAFLELMDGKAVNDEQLLRPRDASKASPRDIEKSKAHAMRLLFYRLIDDRYALPTAEAVKLQVAAYGKK